MIVGARYKYNAKDSVYNKAFDGVIGTLEYVDISDKKVKLRIENTVFYWDCTYESFTFYWKLIED